MTNLVLSLFPGIGLLDMAFEEEGFCVVRGPDLLWGGDVKRFHPPSGRFDGVIGGPPCQRFSPLGTACAGREDREAPDNLIPEYERVVLEAQPAWFVMENVRNAPLPTVPGYEVRAQLLNNRWVGGTQDRVRRFSFGTCDGRSLPVDVVAFEAIDRTRTFTASGFHDWDAETQKSKPIQNDRTWREGLAAQGLPPDFDIPPFMVREKFRAVGNGVPLPMGRAIARAVRAAIRRVAA